MTYRKTRSTRRSTRRASSRRASTRRPSTRRPSTRRAGKIQRQWSREEIAFMRKFYRTHETSWIARQLGRSVYSVRYKAVDLNIKKSRPSVWKGNKGAKNAFAKVAKTRSSRPRKSSSRRSTSRKYKATSRKTRQTRKASSRKNSRTRKASPRRTARRSIRRRTR